MTSKTTKLFNKTKKPNYFREVQRELGKINWTSKEELKTLTKIVIVSTFFLGLGIYFIDLMVRSSMSLLELLTKIIAG